MDVYKVKYVVVVEDENGRLLDECEGYYDTEEEALEFANEMNNYDEF